MPYVEPLFLARKLMSPDTTEDQRRKILEVTDRQTQVFPEDQEIGNVLAAVKSDRFSDDEHLEPFLKYGLQITGGYDAAKPLEEQLKPYADLYSKPDISTGGKALMTGAAALTGMPVPQLAAAAIPYLPIIKNNRKEMMISAKAQMIRLLEESQKQSEWLDKPEDEIRTEAIRRKNEEVNKYNFDRRNTLGGLTLAGLLIGAGTSGQDKVFDENNPEHVKAAVEEMTNSEFWKNAKTARRQLAPNMSEQAERAAYLVAGSKNPEAWGKQVLPQLLDSFEKRHPQLSGDALEQGRVAEAAKVLQMVRVMRPEVDASVIERIADSAASPWIKTGRAVAEWMHSQGYDLTGFQARNIDLHDGLKKEFGADYEKTIWNKQGAVRPEASEKLNKMANEIIGANDEELPFGIGSSDEKMDMRRAEFLDTLKSRAFEGKRQREADRIEYMVENSLFREKFKQHGGAAEFLYGTTEGISYMMQFQAVGAIPVVGGPASLFLMYASMQSDAERKGIYEWGLDPKTAQMISTPVAMFQAAVERQQFMELKGAFGYKEYIGAQDRGIFLHAIGQHIKRSAGITGSETGEEIMQNAADYAYAVTAKYGAQARGIDLTEEYEQMMEANWQAVKTMPGILLGSGLLMRGAVKLSGNGKLSAPEYQMAREDMMSGPERWQAQQVVRRMRNTVRGREDAVDALPINDMREYMRLKAGESVIIPKQNADGTWVDVPENAGTPQSSIDNQQSLESWMESRGYNPLEDKPLFEMKEALINNVAATINDRVSGFNETISGVEDDDTPGDIDLKFYETERLAKILGIKNVYFDTQAEAAAAYSAVKVETDKGTVLGGMLIGREMVMIRENIPDAREALRTHKEEVGHRVVAVNPNKGNLLEQVRLLMGDEAIQALLPEYAGIYKTADGKAPDMEAFSDEFVARKILAKLDTAKGRKLLEEKGFLGKMRSAVLDVFGLDVKSDELAAREVIRLAMDALEQVQTDKGLQFKSAVQVKVTGKTYQRSVSGEWTIKGSVIRDPEQIAMLNTEADAQSAKEEAAAYKVRKQQAEKQIQQMADENPVIKMVFENGLVQMPSGKESTWPEEYRAIPKRFRGKKGAGLPLDQLADQAAALKGTTADYSTSEFRAELEAFEAKAERILSDAAQGSAIKGQASEEAELIRKVEAGEISQQEFDLAMAEVSGARFSVDGRDYTFGQIAESLPVSDDPALLLDLSAVRGKAGFDVAHKAFMELPEEVATPDGKIVLIHNPQGGLGADKLRARSEHLAGDIGSGRTRTVFSADKARWIPMIEKTVFNAQVKIADPQGKVDVFFYVRRYNEGYHYVLVGEGTVVDQGEADYGVITQFASDKTGKRTSVPVVWINEKVKNHLIGKQASGKAALGIFVPATPSPSYDNETPEGGKGKAVFSLADDPQMLAVKKLAWHLVHFPMPGEKGKRTKKVRSVLSSAFKEMGLDVPDNKALDTLTEEAQAVAAETMMERDNGLVDERLLAKFVSSAVGRRWVQRMVADAQRDGEIGGQLWEQEKQKVIRHFEAQGEKIIRKLRGYAMSELKDAQGLSFKELLDAMNHAPVKAPKPVNTDSNPVDLHPETNSGDQGKRKEATEPDAEPDAETDAGGDENAPLPELKAELLRYGVDIRDWMGRILKAVTKQLMADGILRKDMPLTKAMTSDYAEQAYRKTLETMLLENAGALTHSFGRNWISNAILRMRDYTTLQGFDNEAERILAAVNTYRVRESHEELTTRLEEITKDGSQEYRKSRLSELARKYPAVLERIMSRIREAMFLSEDEVAKRLMEIEELGNQSKAADQDAMDLRNELKWVLEQYGAFRFKELSDKKTSIEYLEKKMADGLIAQEQRREALKKQVQEDRDLIKSTLKPGELKGWGAKKAGDLWTGFIFFSQKLEELVSGGTGENYKAASAWAQKFVRDMGFAGYRKAGEDYRAQQDLLDALRVIYGTKDAADVVRDLTAKRPELAQFSLAGQPLSRDEVLQMLAHLGNRRYRNAALIMQEMEQKIQAMSGESAQFALKNKSHEEIMLALLTHPDSFRAYRSEATGVGLNKQQVLAALKSIADGARLTRRLELEDKMLAVLQPGDWQLVEWFREYYRKNRKRLSSASEEITGLMFEENDPQYMPVSVEVSRELISDGGRPLPVTPASLSARTVHFLDLNEQAGGVISMFLSRTKSNHQFLHFAKLHQYTNRLFNDVRLKEDVELAHGASFWEQLKEHATDTIAGGGPKQEDRFHANTITNILAINALAYNASLFFKQMTALPTFSMYADGNFLKYSMSGARAFPGFVKALIDKRATDDDATVQAMLDVFHSDYAQGRMQGGRDYMQREVLGDLEGKGKKYWEAYVRKGMIFTKAGDMVPILIFGGGYYRAKLEEAGRNGMLPEEGKAWALDMLWMLVEQTQSAATPVNQAWYQRRGGPGYKMLGQFAGPTPGYVGKFVHDFRMLEAAKKSGDKERIKAARKQWLQTWGALAVSNAMYTAVGVLWSAILGHWPDEDDAERVLWSALKGPFGGLLIVGSLMDRGGSIMVNGSAFGARGMVPADSAIDPIFYLGNSIYELLHGDLGKAGKSVDRMLSGASAPYRDASKVWKNYVE